MKKFKKLDITSKDNWIRFKTVNHNRNLPVGGNMYSIWFSDPAFCRSCGHHTFPVVCPWSPKQNEVVVWGETDRQALLTETELLVSLRPTLTELPFSTVQVISLRQVLTQDVAATNGVASLWRLTYSLSQLIQMSAGLIAGNKLYIYFHSWLLK